MVESLESRVLLAGSPLDPSVQTALRDTFAGLRDHFAADLAAHANLQTALPLFNARIVDHIDPNTIFSNALYTPVDVYLSSPTPDTGGLQSALSAISYASGDLTANVSDASVSVDSSDPANPTLAVNFTVNASYTKTDTAYAPPDDHIGFKNPSVTADADLTIPFQLQIPYRSTAIVPNEVLVKLGAASITDQGTHFQVTGAHIGMFGMTVPEDPLALDAKLDLAFTGADAGGNLTLAQIQGATFPTLLSVTASKKSMQLDLPISTTLSGIALGASPALSYADTNIFDVAPGAWSLNAGAASLDAFRNMAQTHVQGMLTELGVTLNNLASQLDPPVSIPFVEEALSDIARLGDAVTEAADQLQDTTGFLYDSFQSLVDRLATVTSQPASNFNLHYDPASQSVLMDLKLNKHFSKPILLDFSSGLGPLSVAATADAAFAADVALNLTVGFKLAALGAGETWSDRVFITKGSGITVGADVTASSLNVAAALASIGLAVKNGAFAFGIDASLTAADPGTGTANDNRLYLGEVADNPASSVVTVATPTITVTGSLPIVATSASLNTLLGINVASPPALQLQLTTPNDLSTFTVKPDAKFDALVSDFADFSDLSIYDAISKAVTFLKSSDIGAFNEKLPLINKSINDILGFADGILTSAGGLQYDLNALKTSVQAQLVALDAAYTAAVPTLTDVQEQHLLRLRVALNTALSKADLSALPTDLLGIVQGYADEAATLSGVIDTTPLTSFVTAVNNLLPSLNSLEKRIETLFGLTDPQFKLETIDANDDPAITDRAIVARLTLGKTWAGNIPLDFDLNGGAIPVGITSGGNLAVSAGANLQLDFGVKLTLPPVPFLLETSSLTATLDASVSNLQIAASVGGVTGAQLGTAADPGRLSFKELKSASFTASGTSYTLPAAIPAASLPLALVMVNGTVQTTGYTLSASSLTFGSAPPAGATIKVVYPGTNPASVGFHLVDQSPDSHDIIPFSEIDGGSFTFSINGALNALLPVHLPVVGDIGDFRAFMDISDPADVYLAAPSDIESALASSACDFLKIIEGIDSFLGLLKTGLESDVLKKLPLIGDAVDLSSTLIGKLQSITSGLSGVITTGKTAIQQFLFNNLGPGDGGGPGLDLNVLYYDHDSNPATADIPVTAASQVDVILAGTSALEIRTHLRGSNSITVPFDLGLPALDFQMTGGVDLGLDFDLYLGFGINNVDGFYFTLNNAAPEAKVGISAALTSATSLSAKLFFINLKASEGAAAQTTGLSGNFTVNLVDPNPDPEGHLGISDLLATSFSDLVDVNVTANATIDLDMSADIASNPDLPSLSATLAVNWPFAGTDVSGGEPDVSLKNVRLDLGHFLSTLVGPMLGEINGALKPIKPVLDFINAKLPVISDVSEFLGMGPVTVASVISSIGHGGESVSRFFEVLTAVDTLASSVSGAGSLIINFGDFNFNDDLRDDKTVDADTAGDATPAPAGSAETQYTSASSSGPLSTFLDTINDLGIHFPLFEQPKTIFKLLLGQTVDLITWDIPKLSAGFQYNQTFGPVLPPVPLFVRLFGNFEVFADLGIGFDTRGFQEGHDILDGFYFRDFKNGSDEPEFGVRAEIGAAAELNVVVAKAGVEGGVGATIGADWNDPDDDGRYHLDEFLLMASHSPTCIFDLAGSLDAFLRFYAKLGFDTPFGFVTLFSKNITLVDVTLFDFSTGCTPLPPPVLGHVSDGSDGFIAGTFVAHVGPYASLRQSGAEDEKEKLTFTQDGGNLLVSGFGQNQTYTGVNGIYVNGGAERDTITLEPAVTLPATLIGGEGNDQLRGGSGANDISGGDGNDWISGRAASDILRGDGGDDVIHASAGNDRLEGGDGLDQLFGEDGTDTLYGGADDDLLYGDRGPGDTGGTVIDGNDEIHGDAGNDQLVGAGGADSLYGDSGVDLIEGGDGNNYIEGGSGDDLINAGPGGDWILGGSGNDCIRAGDGPDSVGGEAGFDWIEGEGGNDFIAGGTESDAILGGEGDDSLLGGWGDDIIRGDSYPDPAHEGEFLVGNGKDYIEGGPGDDDICGQNSVDVIWGGTTVFGYPFLGPENPTPPVGGGFSEISCDSPIHWTPPIFDPSKNGTIRGQKFEDLNANGQRDPGEPTMRGWGIAVLDSKGNFVAMATTTSIDIDGNGSIDPESETGVYQFTALPPGEYQVGEEARDGWIQSRPSTPIHPVYNRGYYPVTLEPDQVVEGLDFGNYRNGAIGGRKFFDANANGKYDPREQYLNNWEIQLYDEDNKLIATDKTHDVDLNNDGKINSIDERGWYAFWNLRPGNYRVVEVLLPGYQQTLAPGPITLQSGEILNTFDFGNSSSGGVSGTKWADLNGDAQRQSGEQGVPGVTIYVDLNRDGALTEGEPSALTAEDNPFTDVDEAGHYLITGLPAGAYLIREIVPQNWTQTYPVAPVGAAGGFHSVDVPLGQVVGGLNFGNKPALGSIRGVKFHDINRDGKRGANEPGLAGWYIYLDRNRNGTLDRGENRAVTDQSGQYAFTGLAPGDYLVREVPRAGWKQTSPAGGAYDVELPSAGSIANRDFGNYLGYYTGTIANDHLYLRLNAAARTLQVYVGDAAEGNPILEETLDAFQDFHFDLGAGDDHLTVDFTGGKPIPIGGLSVDGGYGADTLRILGTPSADTVVWNDPQRVNINDGAIGYENLDGMTLEMGDGDDTFTANAPLPLTPRFAGGAGKTTIVLHAGSYLFDRDHKFDNEAASILGDGSVRFAFGASQHLASLTLAGSARATLLPGGQRLLRTTGITIQDQAVLDLQDNTLIVQATANTRSTLLSRLTSQIRTARNSSKTPWTGPGLTSGVAAANPLTGLGIALNDRGNNKPVWPAFENEFVDSNVIIVQHTLNGDADFTHAIDADDYFRADQGRLRHDSGWRAGDWDYDTLLTASDYQLIDLVYANQSRNGLYDLRQNAIVPPSITGVAWNDLNGNGIRETNEGGLPGVTIYIDLNNNAIFDANEPSVTSAADNTGTTFDESGQFAFYGSAEGTYYLRQSVLAGYKPTAPVGGFYTINYTGQTIADRNFGSQRAPGGTVSGTKWLDSDADGYHDSGEPGQPGVTIYADVNNNGKLDWDEPSAVTDESGNYTLYGVPGPAATIRENAPDGTAQSYPFGRRLLGQTMSAQLYDVDTATAELRHPRRTVLNMIDIAVSPANHLLYGLTIVGQLVALNPATGAGTVIGGPSNQIVEGDLDFDPVSSRLYGVWGPRPALYTIDTATGTPTLVGLLPQIITDPSAMAFNPQGRLFIVDSFTSTLHEVDKSTGKLVKSIPIGSDTGPLGQVAGMDFDRDSGILYLAAGLEVDGGQLPALYTLNTTTGKLTLVGALKADLAGIEFIDTDAHTVPTGPNTPATGVDFGNHQVTILPDGNDRIRAGADNDLVFGDNGSGFPPTIVTAGGNDTIWGGAGNDSIAGQDENDEIWGGDGTDLLFGGDGDDILGGDAGNDTMAGLDGDDTYVFTDTSVATVDVVNELPGAGSDTLDLSRVTSTVKFDLNVKIDTRAKNLTIDLQDGAAGDGSAWFENVIGSKTAANTLTGNAADNRLVGGNVADTFTGGPGNNTLVGGDGDDVFIPTTGLDSILGGNGYDRMDYSGQASAKNINLALRNGTAVSWFDGDVELVVGGAGSDTLVGPLAINPTTPVAWNITDNNAGKVAGVGSLEFKNVENLTGNINWDSFIPVNGKGVSGVIDGGAGALVNLLDYSAYTTAVTVDLTAGTATNMGGVNRISYLIGGTGNDVLLGDGNVNVISGGAGNDTVKGYGNNDILFGAEGTDYLEGGLGDDIYPIAKDGTTDVIIEAGGGGTDSLTYASYGAPVTINLQTKTAPGATNMNNIERLVGSAVVDTLIGANVANTWQITGLNSGTVGAYVFEGFEKLTGGTAADAFVMKVGGSITGSLDGATGSDTLDYSTFGAPATINLATRTATAVASFANIEKFIGSGAADTLKAENKSNAWHITGANVGNIDAPGVVDFSGIENLSGGSSTDTYAFNNGAAMTGTIDGAGGSDTLDYSLYLTAITVNLGTSTATGTGGFAGIESFKGGSGDDSFTFGAGSSIAGTLDGGGGSDLMNYAAYVSAVAVNIEAKTATGTGGWAAVERFAGGSSTTDTFTGPNGANTWTINGVNSGSVSGSTFLGFERLAGGVGADRFNIIPGGSVTGRIAGGTSAATDTLSYSAYGAAVTVNLATAAATAVADFNNIESFIGGPAADELIGPNTATEWQLNSVNGGTVGGSPYFSDFENLTGGAGNDSFVVATAGGITGVLKGGAGVDILDYRLFATPVTVNLPAGTATKLGGLSAFEIILGGAGNDILTSDGGDHVLVGGNGDDSLTGNAGRDVLVGGNGKDTLLGGDGEDILIAGASSHDAAPVNYISIRSRWSGAGAYAARVADLKAIAPLLNATTITNDALIDLLTGGAGFSDWFIGGATDNFSDIVAGETGDRF